MARPAYVRLARAPAQGGPVYNAIMNDVSRLEALEIKCAHLERAVQELSDVLHRQQQELDRVLERNQDLARQIETLEMSLSGAGTPADPRAEIPPHY